MEAEGRLFGGVWGGGAPPLQRGGSGGRQPPQRKMVPGGPYVGSKNLKFQNGPKWAPMNFGVHMDPKWVHMEAEGRPNGGEGATPPEKGPLGPIGPYWPYWPIGGLGVPEKFLIWVLMAPQGDHWCKLTKSREKNSRCH